MKRFLSLILAGVLLLGLTGTGTASEPITVIIDGAVQAYEQPPVVVNGSTMVPLRAMFEALGAAIDWNGETRTVSAVKGQQTIVLKVGEETATVNGKPVGLAQKAQIINGRTMVPLRFVSEALGAEVKWHGKTRTIAITTNVGGTVTIGMSSEPVLVVPTASHPVHSLIFDPLMQLDATLTPRPALAEGYSVEQDRIYTFALREGVTWHDGTPLTARDVAYTFTAWLQPNAPGGVPRYERVKGVRELNSRYNEIRSRMQSGVISPEQGTAQMFALWTAWKESGAVRVTDDLHVRVELAEPYAPAFTELANTLILPSHQFEPAGDLLTVSTSRLIPVGTGRYRLTEWVKGQQITLERNPDWHWGVDGRYTRIQHVVMKLITESSTRRMMLEPGNELDVALGLTPADVSGAALPSSFRVLEYQPMSNTYLGYNLKNPLFADARVRQAITHAIDREAIVNYLLIGHGRVVHSQGIPARWDFNPDVPIFEYSVAKAEALLDSAGWIKGPDGIRTRDGVKLRFEIATNRGNKTREQSAIIIQQALKKVGIDVLVNLLEWNAFLDYVDSDQKQAYILGWSLGNDPDATSIFHSKGGFNSMTGYSNPRVDLLLEQGIKTIDQASRTRIYRELQAVLAQEQVYTWLFQPTLIVGVGNRVQGISVDQMGAHGPLWQIERWYVTDAAR